MLRAMLSDSGVGANNMLQDTSQRVRAAIAQTQAGDAGSTNGLVTLGQHLRDVLHSVEELKSYLPRLLEATGKAEPSPEKEGHLSNLRKVAFDLCHLFIAGLLVAHAGPFIAYPNHLDTAVARAWIQNTKAKSPGTSDIGQLDYNVSKTIVSQCQMGSEASPRARF